MRISAKSPRLLRAEAILMCLISLYLTLVSFFFGEMIFSSMILRVLGAFRDLQIFIILSTLNFLQTGQFLYFIFKAPQFLHLTIPLDSDNSFVDDPPPFVQQDLEVCLPVYSQSIPYFFRNHDHKGIGRTQGESVCCCHQFFIFFHHNPKLYILYAV